MDIDTGRGSWYTNENRIRMMEPIIGACFRFLLSNFLYFFVINWPFESADEDSARTNKPPPKNQTKREFATSSYRIGSFNLIRADCIPYFSFSFVGHLPPPPPPPRLYDLSSIYRISHDHCSLLSLASQLIVNWLRVAFALAQLMVHAHNNSNRRSSLLSLDEGLALTGER